MAVALIQTGLTQSEANQLYAFIRECEQAGASRDLNFRDYAEGLVYYALMVREGRKEAVEAGVAGAEAEYVYA